MWKLTQSCGLSVILGLAVALTAMRIAEAHDASVTTITIIMMVFGVPTYLLWCWFLGVFKDL